MFSCLSTVDLKSASNGLNPRSPGCAQGAGSVEESAAMVEGGRDEANLVWLKKRRGWKGT